MAGGAELTGGAESAGGAGATGGAALIGATAGAGATGADAADVLLAACMVANISAIFKWSDDCRLPAIS